MTTTLICYRCAKPIMGKVVQRPAHPMLRDDFPKAFHPLCYGAAEAQARAELIRQERS